MLYLKLFDNISEQFHMYYLNFIKEDTGGHKISNHLHILT